MEFNAKMGQIAFIMCKAQPQKHNDQQLVYTYCPHISLLSPCLFPVKPLGSYSFPAFASSTKHLITRLVPCQNVLPLHPMRSLRHPQAAIPLCLKAAPGSLPSWIRVVGFTPRCVAEGSCDGPGRGQAGHDLRTPYLPLSLCTPSPVGK